MAASQPQNLFTLFAPTHRLEAFESVTGLCPRDRCGRRTVNDGAGLSGLLDDAGTTFLRRISPSDARVDVTTQFVEGTRHVRAKDFSALTSRQQVLARAITNRPARFDGFLRSFHRNEQPTLHFLHLLLPHVPLRFLPSGLEYPAPSPEIGRQGDDWTDGEYATALAHQRALVQTMYVDRLVGQLTARLRATGLLDRSVVALTADHGIAYEPGQPSRALNDDDLPPALYPQLLWAPLVVKAAGQTAGAVSDANVMSIDVLPTLASLADVPTRWPVDGMVAGRRRGSTKLFQRATQRRRRRPPRSDRALRRTLGPHRSPRAQRRLRDDPRRSDVGALAAATVGRGRRHRARRHGGRDTQPDHRVARATRRAARRRSPHRIGSGARLGHGQP